MTCVALDNPRLDLNRPLQWMAFNHRVLERARDPGNPLLEHVRLLAMATNLMDLAGGNVNGSARPREPHLGIALTKGEPAAALSPVRQACEPESQDSANATV